MAMICKFSIEEKKTISDSEVVTISENLITSVKESFITKVSEPVFQDFNDFKIPTDVNEITTTINMTLTIEDTSSSSTIFNIITESQTTSFTSIESTTTDSTTTVSIWSIYKKHEKN